MCEKKWSIVIKVFEKMKDFARSQGVESNSFSDWLQAIKDSPETEANNDLLRKISELACGMKVSKIIYLFEKEKNSSIGSYDDFLFNNKDLVSTLIKYRDNDMKRIVVYILSLINVEEVDDIAVIKYKKDVMLLDLWNQFLKECRGLVIHLKDMTIISAPYTKFFNVGENDESSFYLVQDLMSKSTKHILSDKLDGSLISVSKYKDEVYVASSGSRFSEQAVWAKKMLDIQYPYFSELLDGDLTYLFEAIYPSNRVVVDYHEMSSLILTGIRNKKTGRMFNHDDFIDMANFYGLYVPIKESLPFDEIMQIKNDTDLFKSEDKEGWVLSIEVDNEIHMFKIKCEDYCKMHKMTNAILTDKVIFELMSKDNLDDTLPKLSEERRNLIYSMIADLNLRYSFIKEEILREYNRIPKEILFTQQELDNYKEFIALTELLRGKYPKLSRNQNTALIKSLENKVFKKNTSEQGDIAKYIQIEFDLLPENLKNQSSYCQKLRELSMFVNRKIDKNYINSCWELVRLNENTLSKECIIPIYILK